MYKYIIITILAIYVNIVKAQNHYFEQIQNDFMTKFDNYNVESGLSSNHCNKIYQDSYGYIWIGTEKGLNRFDGHEFIQYLQNPTDSLSISDNQISDITEDYKGNLWVATHNGLNLFDRSNEVFIKFFKQNTRNSLRDNHIRAFLADSIYLWIETLDGTLSKLNLNNFTFQDFKHKKISQSYYGYHAIYKDKNGDIWIGGRNMGPCKFNTKKEIFTYYEPGDISLNKKRDTDVACYFIDNNNTFWVSATDGIYNFDNSKNEFYRLLGTSTFSIIQDKKNNLWFGTGKGAIIYEPKTQKSTLFLYDENNKNSLIDNHINQIYEDNEGNIWFATANGLSKFSSIKNQFGHFYHIPENINSLSSNNVTTIVEDKNGNLWIGYKDKGFDKYNIKNREITHYNSERYQELKSDRISKLYFDKKNQLWIGQWQGTGFQKLDPAKNKFYHYSMDPYTRKRDWYSDFLEDTRGNFWIGLWGASGLHLFNRENEIFEPAHFKPANKPLTQSITSLTNDHENIWIGSNNEILYRYNYKYDEYKAYTNGDNSYSEFQKINYYKLFTFNITQQIIVDSFNKIWFITNKGFILYNPLINNFKGFPLPNENSLELINTNSLNAWIIVNNELFEFNFNRKVYNRLNLNIKEIQRIKFIHQDESSYYIILKNSIIKTDSNFKNDSIILKFSNNEIKNVFTDNEKNLWLIDNEEILIYNNKLSDINYKINNTQLFETDIYSFYDQGNIKWIGTNNGLFAITEFQSIKHYTSEHLPDIIGNQILSLTSYSDNEVLLGTDKGLCLFDIKKELFKPINQPESNSISSHLVSTLFEDFEGNIWIGTTNNGLNKLNLNTGEIIHYTFNPADSGSISDNTINCIYQDNKKNLWIGTKHGLNLLPNKSNQFIRYYKNDGLPGNQINSIIQDENNIIWIGTNEGCSAYNPEIKNFKNYFKSDGLQSNLFSNAALKLNNGEIVLGGENGINIFNPADLKFEYPTPVMQITGFKIFDKKIKSDFTNKENVKLNYKDNFFTIYFSSLNFSNPSQFQYLYKLEGVDPEWVKKKNIYEAKYTNIKPGNYIFNVRSISPDGQESDIKLLTIIIDPPFWQTLWFYFLVALVSFSILSMIFILRLNKLKVEKENILLEQKLLRSQMNPHFIFNVLFSIQNFVYSKDIENVNRFLNKFSRLLRLILENSRVSKITVEDEIQTITNYLDLQKLRFEDKFNYTIDVDQKIETEELMIPPMLAQPFIENAIEHGFKERDKFYIITINFKLTNNNLIYIIEDNGIGIEKSIASKMKNEKQHQSLGIRITKERLVNLKKITKQNIKIRVIDLNNENKQGTRVMFTIPL